MPANKKKQTNKEKEKDKDNRKKNKKVVSSDSSDSESETEYDSDYNPSSPSNSRFSGNFSVEDDEEETVYTEYDSEEETKSGDSSEEKEFDNKKFRKTIAKLFPSKYSKEKAKDSTDKKSKRHPVESESEESEDPSEPESVKKSSRKHKKHNNNTSTSSKKSTKKSKHRASDESSESEKDDDSYVVKKQFLVLNIGGDDEDDDYDYDDDNEVDSLTEDTAEDFDSDAEKTFMGDAYKKEESAAPPSSSSSDKKSKQKKNNPQKETKLDKKASNESKNKGEEDRNPIPENVENEYKEMLDVRKMLMEQLKRRPKNKFLKRSLDECNANIKKLTRKARHENTNAYYKLVNSDRRKTDEIDYFKHRLSNKDQQGIMADLKEINRTIYSEKPYRLSILQSKIPSKFKAIAIQRLNTLKSMDPGDHEYYKIKNWVDAFMRIPFGVYRSIDIKMSDGIEVCNKFMESAKQTLDKCVYGLNDAKLQIMQMLGQWIVNPDSIGTSIAIHGPPGTGKTSIVKDGISKILGREFAFIALGGCGDGSFLEGHSYTYEGSTWGKIVQILMECKSMNPIIYFDELDKVSDTARGQEIIGILTHLTDTTQNAEFHDKYFSEVSLDLSKCLFIFSYNDESAVNPILKDRMYRIQTKGYDTKEKITIARDYLLPKIRDQVKFTVEDIMIPDETLQYIISTPHLTKNESGVRNLKRCLEIVYTKLNLYRLVKPGNSMFEKDLGVNVQFPIQITRKEVDIFIKNNETMNPSVLAMYL
jgi:ATP-dependent Lon protease